jgi:hypothetical protein
MSDAEKIATLVEREIERITDTMVVARIRQLLVTPRAVRRSWDYGKPGECYTCWVVLEHPESNTAIAFCSEGFGPSDPWGLIFLSGPHMGIGMDCSWFVSMEQAFRESMAWDGSNPHGYEVL